ncbi:MAG: serine hydrolase domain-containing protein [Pseudomonadota bacterium]
MTRLIAIFAILVFGNCAAAQEPDFSALKDRLARYVEDGDLPGGVVLVRQGNDTLLSHAFGYRDVEAADPMDLGDQFRIASQTKLIVSVGIMMLIEEGAITLETPLASIFPEWAEVQVATPEGLVPLDRPIVIRDLLSHSSGIGYGFTDAWAGTGLTAWYFAGSARPMRESVRLMATMPLNNQPGASWTYGYNTDILGALIMELMDQSLGGFLEERVFLPLGMTDTQFFLSPDEAENLAVVYSRTDDLTLVRAPDPGGPVGQGHYVNGPQLVESGGAGLISSAEDYATFLDMLRAGGIHDGQRLLKAETVALMPSLSFGALRPLGILSTHFPSDLATR